MDEITMLALTIVLALVFLALWRMIVIDDKAREERRLPPLRKHLTKSNKE